MKKICSSLCPKLAAVLSIVFLLFSGSTPALANRGITSPQNGAIIHNTFPPFYGRASSTCYDWFLDYYYECPIPGYLNVIFQRTGDGRYWNGYDWSLAPNPIELPAAYDANSYTWAYLGLTPPPSNFPDGVYVFTVKEYDGAHDGQPYMSTAVSIRVDTTRPTVDFTAPTNGATLSSSSYSLSGTATDSGGSGIDHVSIYFQRKSDLQYWTGSGWGVSEFALPTVLGGGNSWLIGNGLPTGSYLTEGDYILQAKAYDRGGNTSSKVSTVHFDKTPPPAPVVTFPADGSTVAGIPYVTIHAQDNAGGSGICQVQFSLQRVSDGKFWDVYGSNWTPIASFIPAWQITDILIWELPCCYLPAGNVLSNGAYRIGVMDSDCSGYTTNAVSNFTVNKINPSIFFTSPTNGASYSIFPLVYGTASAAQNLTIQRVDFYLAYNWFDEWVGQWTASYWDGSQWLDYSTPTLPTTLTGSNSWAYTGGIPTGTDELEGPYSVLAYAYDSSGNRSFVMNNFSIDKTPPTVTRVEFPSNNVVISSLPGISGTAMDNAGGSGLQSVGFSLLRKSDGKYWSGSAWNTFSPACRLAASLSDTNWSRNINLPGGADLPEGSYAVTVWAKDRAGNTSTIQSNNFIVDVTSPYVTILNPRGIAPANSFSAITGTAWDNPGGSGLDRVQLTLQRNSDSKYWNGAAWQPAPTWLLATLDVTNWSLAKGLPTGLDLTEGDYTINAYSYDRGGNATAVLRTFTLRRFPPTCRASLSAFTNTTAAAIPDLTTVTSTISVSNVDAYLWDVDLTSFITHTWPGDLVVTLRSPAGTVVTITSNNARDNDNVFNGTTWDDQAGAPVTDAVFVNNMVQPRLIPEAALGAFIGQNPNGLWTLSIHDAAPADTGALTNWSLLLATFPAAPASRTLTFSQTRSAPLPDNGATNSALLVSGLGQSLLDVNLTAFINHPANQELKISLSSPAGSVTTLSSGNGGSLSNVLYGTRWDDSAPVAITDYIFSNGYGENIVVPEGAMSAFIAENPNGLWTMTIEDTAAGNTGTLSRWDLRVTTCDCAAKLAISRAGRDVVISWSTNYAGYRLESSSSLGPANWTTVLPNPSVAGSQNVVTNPATGSKFYRLAIP